MDVDEWPSAGKPPGRCQSQGNKGQCRAGGDGSARIFPDANRINEMNELHYSTELCIQNCRAPALLDHEKGVRLPEGER